MEKLIFSTFSGMGMVEHTTFEQIDLEDFLMSENITLHDIDSTFQMQIDYLWDAFQESLKRLDRAEAKYSAEAERYLREHSQRRRILPEEFAFRPLMIKHQINEAKARVQEGFCNSIRLLKTKYCNRNTKAKANGYNHKITTILNKWFADHVDSP